MHKSIKSILLFLPLAILFLITSCNEAGRSSSADNEIILEFEKYELENGLDVILHEDKSDPIVAMAIQYGVGSNREKTGRTGFAHLFEHMLFQESENVGQDQFFAKIQDAGGTLNGGTWKDGTIYYEIVPKNALEKIMWLESDRMGFFINTVTESAFYNQQEVVQNEKRQRVDNNPYGHTNWVIDKNIYPEGHPYNWQVIGELVDLQNATVDDVREFYDRFYGPNNATLVIAGDFDAETIKPMIEKYFGEIERRQEVAPMEPMPVTLSETKRLMHEDNFAQAPQLNMVFPTVQQYTEDAYALDFLGQLMSQGKKAPLYKVLVEEKELTSNTLAFNYSQELAGAFRIRITANDGKNLQEIEDAIFEAFALFEEQGITDRDIERIKASTETIFYDGNSSILGKAFNLAQYNVFVGDPGFLQQDLENIQKVTKEQVMAVYEKYIKDKPYVLTSFVPKGQMAMAAENSAVAPVVEEEIKENITKEVIDTAEEIAKTPSTFDRSVEPEAGAAPTLNIPASWNTKLDNGMMVYGIEQNEIPTVNFRLIIEGGHLLDDMEKNGVANLMADIMMEGTANKTPQELEEEIELLGASLNVYTTRESIVFSGNTLVRNFEKLVALVEEILLQPRWDEVELARVKTATINDIMRSNANPNVVARNVWNKLLYGEGHPFAYPTSGTVESVESITIDDLKAFYEKNFSPSISRFLVVGKIDQDQVVASLNSLESNWSAKEVTIPEFPVDTQRGKSTLAFVDIPNAKQSVINIGYLSMARDNPDFYPAEVMNYKLGGSFSGNVNMILREEKGYTYGARTSFSGTKTPGTFKASSSVRTNTTGESVAIFREQIEKYKEGITEEELDFTKNALVKSNARRFETQRALLEMLSEMSNYGLAPDYIKNEEAIAKGMTLEMHKELANKLLDENRMLYLVVGDAATQFAQFKDMGFDEVKLLDKDGSEVKSKDVTR